MSLYVNTNVSSLNAQRQLMNSSNGLNTAFERLSSGSRINSAADDAAGLQITNRMTSQINGLNQAVRNANDGISVAQVAEGALQETTNLLQRMRELVVQADNGINSNEDKRAIQEEMMQLQEEIGRIAKTTEFSGIKLLSGSPAADADDPNVALDLDFLVGARGGNDETITVSLKEMSTARLGEEANVATDADTVATFTNAIVDAEGGINVASIAFFRTDGDGGFATATEAETEVGQPLAALNEGDLVATGQSSKDQLAILDKAIADVGSQRSELGAIQNRFQSTIANLSNVAENVSGARSRIMDTDFAAETANLTKFQITQQASTSILAQANQRPQAALSLLG